MNQDQGRFKSARGRWHDCIITGIVVRQYGGDYLIINYTTEDGDYIQGAEIPRDGFCPANARGMANTHHKNQNTLL